MKQIISLHEDYKNIHEKKRDNNSFSAVSCNISNLKKYQCTIFF